MNFENFELLHWLLILLCLFIGLIFGYYWGKGNKEVIDNSADLKTLEDKNARLQADLDACNKKLAAVPVAASATSKKRATPKARPKTKAASVTPAAFDAGSAKAAFGKRVKQDDLKVVEGIGPKIEGLFHDSGIKTWKALSEATVAQCNKVLKTGGDRYRIHDPASWPMQAKMAYKGDWKKLAKWQDEHKGGKL